MTKYSGYGERLRRAESLFRIRSRRGHVHLSYGREGPSLCLLRLAGAKYTTHGAVTCKNCIMIRDNLAMWVDVSGFREPRYHLPKDCRAATRIVDGKLKYLAHWVSRDRSQVLSNQAFPLEEHRLYVQRSDGVANYDGVKYDPGTIPLGIYYCDVCYQDSERKDRNGLPISSDIIAPDAFGEAFPEFKHWRGLEPEHLGDIAPDDPTIHETGRKLPREPTEKRRKRMLADLEKARKKWRKEHEPSMAEDSPSPSA